MKSYNYINSIINITKNIKQLQIEIETKRSKLKIKSIDSQDDIKYYKLLFQDSESIAMYSTGQILDDEKILARFEIWYNRFNNNCDPYSSFMVFNSENQFIGHVCLGHSSPGISECSILLLKKFWGKGLGFEILNAIVNEYSCCLVSENYTLDGEPLKKILATARIDNDASNKILIKCGFSKYDEKELYGNIRNFYQLPININK